MEGEAARVRKGREHVEVPGDACHAHPFPTSENDPTDVKLKF